MDYSLLTEEIFLKRFDSLPDHIQGLLSSEQAQKLIVQIGKSHYLNREKIETLEQIISLILMGFVHLRNLKREISDKLFLNYDHTVALANDLDQELFREIQGDLEQVYAPIEEEIASLKEVGEPLSSEKPEQKEEGGEESKEINIPIHEEKMSSLKIQDENSPLILVEEKGTEQKEERVSAFKDFSKSFSFFGPKMDSSPKSPVQARVELPKEKKVVHYSELRSSISSFDRGSDFINLKTKEDVGEEGSEKKETVGVTEIKLKPGFLAGEETNPTVIKQEKPPQDEKNKEVGLEGNKIDLRNI